MKYPDITLGRVEAVWNKLGGEEGVQRLLAGYCKVVVKEHVINCDADPFVPDGWGVEEHQKGGPFTWDASKVKFYLSKKQKGSSYIEGNKLREELKGQPVYNANLLDYLLKNPHLIPEEWKKDEKGNTRYIFFWGTVYRRSDGYLCVRYLCWSDGGWRWSDGWLDHDWYDGSPAAVPAS
jgi:hypothetical protein